MEADAQISQLEQALIQQAGTLAREALQNAEAARARILAESADKLKLAEEREILTAKVEAERLVRRQTQADRPFVLMVSYGTPHFPHHTAPQEYKDLYPLDKILLPPNVPPELQDKARQEAQGYYAHCTALDKCVGDVLATLDETGLAQRTVLVFTSDHGEMLGSHGKPPSMKQVPWDEAARVPFLLRYPAAHGPQGRDVPTPLTTPDILPTLLGLAGVSASDTVEGEDLSGLVRGQPEPADRAALYMAVAPFAGRGFNKEYRALRTRRYTYVRGLEGPWLLFDDQQDPHQLDNLIDRPEFASLPSGARTEVKR